MATDLEAIVRSLAAFYPFEGKAVVTVGAGGGQLIEVARPARRVVAVDPDPAAMERLARRARDRGLAEKLTLLTSEWLATEPEGDVVFFEFCLHEMAEPGRALDHARRIAPEVLVADHAPGSPWEWLGAEERGVEAAWAEVESRAPRRRLDVRAFQRFADFEELRARLEGEGPECHRRLERYRGTSPIEIEMPYRLALI